MSVPNTPPAMMFMASQPLFTVAQWQELENQALIFKYLKAGLTVPPHLLLLIQKSLQLIMSQQNHSFGLSSETDKPNFLQKDLRTMRYQGFYESTSDDTWSLMSQIPQNIISESRNRSTMVKNCFQQRTMRNAELLNLYDDARSKELVFDDQLSSPGCLKQEYHSPQSLFSDSHFKMDLKSSSKEML